MDFNDAEGLGSSLLQLLHQPDEARRIGQAGRQLASEHFNLQTALRRYEALFERLLNASSR